MQICLVTPAAPRSLSGNRATASRWARLLRRLGHQVNVVTAYSGEPADLMIALHAWRSRDAVRAFRERFPQHPLVVMLTGTDAYRFIHSDPEDTLTSLQLADKIVGLHDLIAEVVPASLRHKVSVIRQSAHPTGEPNRPKRFFRLCIAGHLREEKDPLRAAIAARELSAESRIRVDAFGRAHTETWAAQALEEMARNPRYVWHGEVSHSKMRGWFRRSHALVLSSVMEGGANVISEAVMADLPVLASAIPGSIGLLGAGYPGYFPAGDSAGLLALMRRLECEPTFYQQLLRQIRALRPLFEEQAEAQGLSDLIDGLST